MKLSRLISNIIKDVRTEVDLYKYERAKKVVARHERPTRSKNKKKAS